VPIIYGVVSFAWKVISSFVAILFISCVLYLFEAFKPDFKAYFQKMVDLLTSLSSM
jgi:hypothetical protein